ncbi:MAG: hypothetical protein JWM89_3590, partial [Acidimicrobiales bacterium]|nr:hypothetical protein [Acidimicrobiales bacterium]
MAAIIQPHRLPNTRPARPALVLLPGGQASPGARPAGLVPAI